ncbi:MAG TPA: GntR family transcriptional regulator YhfZ [Symbiobacteriaceae bacterium]|nr:GntR family transcriptional regulator YhfZ [Symbiobacteriaceae bacterium]
MLHRYGSVAESLALRLLALQEGERLAPVHQLAAEFGTGRGTVQSALKVLTDGNAVVLETQGNRGSFIRQVDRQKLLTIAGVFPLIGAMPVAYSTRFQGLAAGLTRAFEAAALPLVLAQLRGGRNRLHFLRTGRCDFAVISKLAWQQEEPAGDVVLVHSFGAGSNVSDHVLVLARSGARGIEDGMRVGVDPSSYDHVRLTQAECEGKAVTLVEISYAQALPRLLSGAIDAAVWDMEVPLPTTLPVAVVPREHRNPAGDPDTEAVMVTRSESGALGALLARAIQPATVTEIQRRVLAGAEMPVF